jgi:hypothetical protein
MFRVFAMSPGGLKRILFSTHDENEAAVYCAERNYRLKDKRGFYWSVGYDDHSSSN